MQDATPSITLKASAASMPQVLIRITAFLLHHEYAFLQTFQPAQTMVVDIFPSPSQLGLRLSLQPIESDSDAAGPRLQVPTHDDHLPSETASLLQRLLEVCDLSRDGSPQPNTFEEPP